MPNVPEEYIPDIKVLKKIKPSKEELEELAMNSEVIKKWLEGKEIVKVICVPNRIVNIVIR